MDRVLADASQTAEAVLYRELGIELTYTLTDSFLSKLDPRGG